MTNSNQLSYNLDAHITDFLPLNSERGKDGYNWYAYVGNDPINYTDPFGLCSESTVTVFASGFEILATATAVAGSTSHDGSAGDMGIVLGKGYSNVTFDIPELGLEYTQTYDLNVTGYAGVNFGAGASITAFVAEIEMTTEQAQDQEFVEDSYTGNFNVVEASGSVVTGSYFFGENVDEPNWEGFSTGFQTPSGPNISAMQVDYTKR